jgi:hypothetical protein
LRQSFGKAFCAGAIALGALGAAGAARASLPDAIYSGSIEGDAADSTVVTPLTGPLYSNVTGSGAAWTYGYEPGVGYYHIPEPGSAFSYIASIGQTPSPYLSLAISASAPTTAWPSYSNAVVSGAVDLIYYMQVSGPNDSISIQVKANGISEVTSKAPGAVGNNYAQNHINIIDGALYGTVTGVPYYGEIWGKNSSINAYGGTSYTGPDTDAFSASDTLTLLTNHPYVIHMHEDIYASVLEGWGGGTESLSTYLDPTFIVTGPDASEYTFAFSQGIGNSPSPAPAPALAVWPMLLAGIGKLGDIFRRRRSASALGVPQAA